MYDCNRRNKTNIVRTRKTTDTEEEGMKKQWAETNSYKHIDTKR